jgi:hypothetical protein
MQTVNTLVFHVRTLPWWRFLLPRHELYVSRDGGRTRSPLALCWTLAGVRRVADDYARWMSYWERV